jgi:hypothetical protein
LSEDWPVPVDRAPALTVYIQPDGQLAVAPADKGGSEFAASLDRGGHLPSCHILLGRCDESHNGR